jgi:hypothetical protein
VGLRSLFRDSCIILYVDYVHTSQKILLWISTAWYKDSVTISYVDDVRTSQKTHLCVSRAC